MAEASAPSLLDVRELLERAAGFSELARWIEDARGVIEALARSRASVHAAAIANQLQLPHWDEPQSEALDHLVSAQTDLIRQADESLKHMGGHHG